MRKLKYILLLSVAGAFFAGCLKNSAQVTGPAGAQGATGAPGGDFLQYHTSFNLRNSLVGTSPTYSHEWVFNNYNPNGTYMVTAYVSKYNSQNVTSVWNKLPYLNMYQAGDDLYVTLTKDTVKINYFNTSAQFPDSNVECEIIVIPQQ